MTADTTPVERKQLREDRLGVLVALAVHPRPTQIDEHPSAEDLAAFSEGRLDATHRERILSHLNACSDCYEEWFAVTELLGHRPVVTEQPKTELLSPLIDAWQAIQSWADRLLGAGRPILWSGAAVAACLVLTLLAPWRTDSGLPTLIEKTYETAQANPASALRETAARQLLPWEAPTAGFSFSTSASEAALAFAAGQWEGRSLLADGKLPAALPTFLRPTLSGSNPASAWRDTEWADYAWLGRWVFLLQAVCRTPQADSTVFWDQQSAIGLSLRERLGQRPNTDTLARPATKLAQGLHDILSDSNLSANRDRRCQKIEQQSKLAQVFTPPKP